MATVPLQHDAAHMPMPKAHGFQTSARCSRKSGASVRRSWKGSTSGGLCWSRANQPPQRTARNLRMRKKCQRTKSLALLVHYTRARKKAPRGKVGPALAAAAARCGPPIPIPPFDSPIRQSTLDAAPASSRQRYEASAMLWPLQGQRAEIVFPLSE